MICFHIPSSIALCSLSFSLLIRGTPPPWADTGSPRLLGSRSDSLPVIRISVVGEKTGDFKDAVARGVEGSIGSRKNLTMKEYSAQALSIRTISADRKRASTGAF